LRRTGNFSVLRLPSGELRFFHATSSASLGSILSSTLFNRVKLTKAGHSRWRRRRPIVRGVAMNPIDHPHGGGEGKTSGGRPSVSPWAILTKGKPTRSPRKALTQVIKTRRQVKLN